MSSRIRVIVLAFVLMMLSGFSLSQDKIVIRLILGNFVLENTSNINRYFEPFREQYPDVEIVIVRPSFNSTYAGASASNDVDKYLDHAKRVSESADVFYVESLALESEKTLSGSLLDMSPLLRDDPQTEDFFYPVLLDSFRWDNGVWALPVSASPIVLYYNSEVFDEEGLSYPDSSWQLEDFVNAVEALTVRDAEGKIVRPGFAAFTGENDLMLVRSLSDVPFYNADVVPNPPQLDNPEIISAVAELRRLRGDGSIYTLDLNAFWIELEKTQALIASIPMTMSNSVQPTTSWNSISVLPNGYVGVTPAGYAISSGTQHPEIAYALARFMATDPELADLFRISSVGTPIPVSPQFYDSVTHNLKISGEVDIINTALTFGLPYSEARYWSYLFISDSEQQPLDGVIQEIQAKATDNFKLASELDFQLSVDSQSVNFDPNTTLFVGIKSGDSTISDEDRWLQITNNIVDSDDEIEAVSIETFFNEASAITDYDCIVTDEYFNRLSRPYLDMQPIISVSNDSSLADTIDVLYEAYDNGLTGVPIAIDPAALVYDSSQLTQAVLTLDGTQWTSDTLSYLSDTKQINISSVNFPLGNFADVIQLLIMFGAVPDDTDSRQSLDWSDDRTVEAVQIVSDLIADNVIVSALFDNLSSDYAASIAILEKNYVFSVFSSDILDISAIPGNDYVPVSFSLWSGYVAEGSSKLDQCMQLFRGISEQYDLVGLLPATYDGMRNTVADSDDRLAEFIDRYEEILSQPNVIYVSRVDSLEYRTLNEIMLEYIGTNNRDELAGNLQDLYDRMR